MKSKTNRLNKIEASLWNIAWDTFVKTGVWKMPKRKTIKENIISKSMGKLKAIKELGIETNIPTTIPTHCPIKIGTHLGLEKKSLMASPENIFDRNRYPGSRDWDLESLNIKCGLKDCAANYNGKCTMPSLISMSKTGKCVGYHPRKKKRNE